MCWMDFHNAILCCGFLCTLLTSFYFTATTPRATTPHPYHHGLSRLCMHPGYHTIVYIYSYVITPKLPRSTTHVHRVITPAISNSYFVVFISPAFTPPLLTYTTTGRHTLQPTPQVLTNSTISLEQRGQYQPTTTMNDACTILSENVTTL